jgi:uncharacterized OB-fold protein
MNNHQDDNKEEAEPSALSGLEASKCSCPSISVPPVKFCYRCNSRPEIVNISSKGTVLSFTLLHVTASGSDSPLGIALVELAGGAVIMCNTVNERILNIGWLHYLQ